MSAYVPPLADIRFVLGELVGLERVSALPPHAELNDGLVDAVLDEAAKFATGILDPLYRAGDREGARLDGHRVVLPDAVAAAYAKFVAGGWNGLEGPVEHGGQGLPHLIAVAVQELWNGADMAFHLCPMLTSGVVEALVHHGSAEQRRAYLPKLVSGEWTGTMNLTEPQAGSDLAAIRTRAVREGDHYRIYGTKIFVTWGEHDLAGNIVHLVLARTPDAPEGVKGLSLFVVPKHLVNADGSRGARNDVRCVALEHKLGIHGSPTCVLAFGDEGGAVGELVGEENHGLDHMFTMMNHARLGVALQGVGIAARACGGAVAYARERVQGRPAGTRSGPPGPIIRHPDVRRMLLAMRAHTEAMRALVYLAAFAYDSARHEPDDEARHKSRAIADFLTPIAKGWCTEKAIEVASLGVQVHGGMGYVEETGAAQCLRDARITTIYEGTTGIQANDLVARKVGRDGGATARALVHDMRVLAAELARVRQADVAAIHAAFDPAVTALAGATAWMVQAQARDPAQAAAVAVPYLMLWGTVAGGWQMARAALIASAKIAGKDGRSFHKTKLATARFYAEHVLPQAGALAAEVISGAGSVLAVQPEDL